MIKFEDIKIGSIIRFEDGPPKPTWHESNRPIRKGLYKVIEIFPGLTHTGKKQYDTSATLIKISKDYNQIGKYKYYYCMNYLMEKGSIE